jgi:hypothetical protein
MGNIGFDKIINGTSHAKIGKQFNSSIIIYVTTINNIVMQKDGIVLPPLAHKLIN